jgi:ubiquitin-activating enzyme E1
MSLNEKEIKVDDDLYSRSIFTYGMDTMKKLSSMKILIIGMRGVGIETAKNIILNGPKEVDIFDPNPVRINDLGANFYLSEENVGKQNRDEACLPKLSKLNPYVQVSILKVEPKNTMDEYLKYFCEKIKKYNVVVFTELHPMYFIVQIDNFCRSNNIKLIYGFCLGLVGYIFADFGQNHIIFDDNGREIKKFLVKSITRDKQGLVTIDTIQGTNNLNIGDGDFVRFKNVGGMVELNDEKKDFMIFNSNYESFKIGDTSKFSEYTKGGIVYQVKKPITKQYYPFCQRAMMFCDKYHPVSSSDGSKNGRTELLYMALSGIHDFYIKNNCTLPEVNNEKHYKEIAQNVKSMYETVKKNKIECYENIQEFDEKIVENVARWSSCNIPPVCCFFGGIIAQEIIKATGKYIPIDQWLIYDFFETVENLKDNIDRTLKNCRYDDQIAIFGNEIQEKIQKSNIFMIGAGATGCEFLKNFAMMGFCTDKKSKFIITDNDNIEISNLTRQFLFNKSNVGQSKSTIAAISAQKMNPNFNVEAKQEKVCVETEEIFNEDCWNNQDIIVYAVDSIDARKYIDNQVILHQKIGVDSGTSETQARSNIFIPHKTSTYNDIDQSDNTLTLPVCTLRHFPSLIEHCIEWSRDSFDGYFGNIINDVKEFFVDYNKFKEKIKREGTPKYQLNKLSTLKSHIDMIVNKDLHKICEYAIKCYTDNFDHNIQQLLITFPPNYKNKEGKDFWVGSKRLPHPIQFSTDIDLCLIYVTKFAYILSHALGIEFTKDELSSENIKKICSSIEIPKFFKKNIKIDLDEESNKNSDKKINENQIKEQDNDEDLSKEDLKAENEMEKIIKELDKVKREEFDFNKINPEEFEKDHDENGHIDFIHAGTNLRARNYTIEECDRNKTKQVAGNIIPTILTTTACVAGITSLQFYTMLHTNDIKYFRNCYFNLINNHFYFYEPNEPIKMKDKAPDGMNGAFKAIPNGWTVWDFIEVRGSKTCKELVEYLKKEYNINVETLLINQKMIYDTCFNNCAEIKVEDAYKNTEDKKINENKKYLLIDIIGTVPEAEIEAKTYKNPSVSTPKIKYIFK